MYSQSANCSFLPQSAHKDRLAIVTGLVARNPKYFTYKINYSFHGHECVLTALMPDVWADIVLTLQSAQQASILTVVSPKSISGVA
jgi:histidinol-phosphate/aromatic aminotransferase/cobyric acid decarboxylase-like protein